MARRRRSAISYDALKEHDHPEGHVRKTMQSNKRSGSAPELAVRKALWAIGLRGYRLNVKALPGKPDIVYPRAKVAVFVQGCFWHHCPKCRCGKWPIRNARYWKAKIGRNAERDRQVTAELSERGYEVVALWECDVKRCVEKAVEPVAEAVALRVNRPARIGSAEPGERNIAPHPAKNRANK